MGELFPNQYFGIQIWKHKGLPILETHDFDFYRCLEFKEIYYGKTISELHKGNLRLSRADNRYSNLFPGQKISYWADSPKTARAEVKKWGAKNNLLTFWAYDDGSSFIPTVYPVNNLRIVDGIHFGFDEILKKIRKQESLSHDEQDFIDRIALAEPDCLAYKSEVCRDGICYLFFEHGFKKLSLKEVSLRLGDYPGKNYNTITCAVSCDFTPSLKKYGYFFLPKAKIKYDEDYINTEEYILRKQVAAYSWKKIGR